MKIWTCGSSPRSGPEMPERQQCQSCQQFLGFFRLCAIQMISCRDWWSWTKTGYMSTYRRQSNNQWSDGMARHLNPPEITVSEKIRWKISGLDFCEQDDILLIGYLPKDLTITRSVTHFCWCNWGTFWRRNAAEISQRSSCSFRRMALLNGPLQPTKYWPTWVSNALITHSILRIWPRLTAAFRWTGKPIEISPFFFRRGLVGRKISNFF